MASGRAWSDSSWKILGPSWKAKRSQVISHALQSEVKGKLLRDHRQCKTTGTTLTCGGASWSWSRTLPLGKPGVAHTHTLTPGRPSAAAAACPSSGVGTRWERETFHQRARLHRDVLGRKVAESDLRLLAFQSAAKSPDASQARRTWNRFCPPCRWASSSEV